MEGTMVPRLRRLAAPAAFVVLILSGMSLARASLDELAVAGALTSSTPMLLGPINGLGRTGWDCAPEKAARAVNARAAELPDDTGR
jgi:hypothetical protein